MVREEKICGSDKWAAMDSCEFWGRGWNWQEEGFGVSMNSRNGGVAGVQG